MVVMVESTHDRKSDDLVAYNLRRRNRPEPFRNLLLDPLMRSCLVEVGHIGIEHALELLLLNNQQMIQAFLSDAPQEALTDRIGSGRMNRRFQDLDAAGCGHTSEARPKFGIVIPNQVLWRLSIRGGFSQLLRHPGIGRRARYAHMDHLACLELDEEEGKEWSKEQVSHLQEVACPDLRGVVAKKGRPLLSSWLVGANRPHVLLDSALAHPYAQFQEFPTDPFSTPESILPRHLPDQGDGFLGDLGPVRSGLGLVLPVQAKELPMPPQQGVWLHDHEGLPPGSNQPGQQDQEDAIGLRACGPFHLPLQDNELLAQEGNFGHQFRLASAQVGQGGERQGGSERFGPTSQTSGEGIQAAIQEPLESGENTTHTKTSPSHESIVIRA
jgi:hypothetical protein